MKAPWWFCHGWHPRSLWCLLDVATGCAVRRICDAHDKALTDAWEKSCPEAAH